MTPEIIYISHFLYFLLATVVSVFLFRRIKASPVLGYLAAGILIGPHVLKIITDPTITQVVGGVGVLFLLFALGLELPLQRLQAMRKYVFGLGASQVFVTGAIFTLIGLWSGLPNETALLIGGALALSSTAVVLQVLTDRKELATHFGRVSFSILLFQDISVVLLLVLTSTLGTENVNIFYELTRALFKTFIVLLVIIGIGRLICRPIYRAVAASNNPELFMATTFLVVLGTAYLTEVAGLSMELGAFLAGILLAETEYRHQVEADIQPFRGLLLGVFFMSVGMDININVLLKEYGSILVLLSIIFPIKILVTYLFCRLFKLKLHTSLRVSLLLAEGGEFIFVIFSPLVSAKFLPPGIADILFITVIISMALTPFLAMFAKWASDRLQIITSHAHPQMESEELGEFKNHIILAGFGRVGQMLAELFAENLIPFVGVDTDMKCVSEGRAKGWSVFYGDSRRVEVLKSLGATRAKAIVITVDQVNVSVRTVLMCRRYFPHLPVCVRVKDHKHQQKLLDSGAQLIVPETVEPTIQLATSIFQIMGISKNQINKILEELRKQ